MVRFLMCPPDYYGIEYEINPWMNRERQAYRELAEKQWNDIFLMLSVIPDATVELLQPQPGLPDLVFTANAGLVRGDLFISSNFRHNERRGESPHYEKWFHEHGYRVEKLASELSFEGAGDVLRAGGTWFGGYYYRSEPRALAAVSEILGEQVLPLRLTDERFYHLDTCFSALGDSIIYYPAAFDEYSRAVIRDRFPDAVEVVPEEAAEFACNSVVIDDRVIMNSVSPKLCRSLSERGFKCFGVDLSEFIKAGGSAKCLTLRLE
jgi:N-dimethylarginine dimethylaminohydrolase